MTLQLARRIPGRTRACGLTAIRLGLIFAVLQTSAAAASAARAPQIQVDKPKTVDIYKGSDQVKLNGSSTGPCVDVKPPIRLEGTARNGQYQGHMELEVRSVDEAKGTVTAKMEFSDGLLGEGTLDGTLTETTMTLNGRIRAFPGGTFKMQIRGEHGAGSLKGTYVLSHTDGSGPQQGQFSLTGHTGVDSRIVGAWAMVVPGGAVSYDIDHGNYITRIQEVSAGTAGEGALVIDADGSYRWTHHGSMSGGRLSFCATPNGESGWMLTKGREKLWARWAGGKQAGLYLSIPGLNMYQFQGSAISSKGAPAASRQDRSPAPRPDAPGPRESAPSPADSGSGGSSPSAARAYVGTWRGINWTAGELKVFPDGRFTFNGTAGTYRMAGTDIVFSEPLKAWNNGRAHLTNGSIEFYWTTEAGAKQWMTFGKIQ